MKIELKNRRLQERRILTYKYLNHKEDLQDHFLASIKKRKFNRNVFLEYIDSYSRLIFETRLSVMEEQILFNKGE